MGYTPQDAPELPALDPGLTLLEAGDRVTGALQSLVLDQVLEHGAAVWIDAKGRAKTQYLASIAPSMRVLERVSVARAFTPFQHFALVGDVHAHLDDDTSVLVVPEVDWFYGEDDLRQGEGAAMLTAVLDGLATLADTYDVPVLLTRSRPDDLGATVADRADAELSCVTTREGARFVSAGFETQVYHRGGYVQTTLAFWREVLEARQAAVEQPGPAGVATVGTH